MNGGRSLMENRTRSPPLSLPRGSWFHEWVGNNHGWLDLHLSAEIYEWGGTHGKTWRSVCISSWASRLRMKQKSIHVTYGGDSLTLHSLQPLFMLHKCVWISFSRSGKRRGNHTCKYAFGHFDSLYKNESWLHTLVYFLLSSLLIRNAGLIIQSLPSLKVQTPPPQLRVIMASESQFPETSFL